MTAPGTPPAAATALAFLIALSRTLTTLGLYSDDHPSAARSVDSSFRALERLLREDPAPTFSFLEDEVYFRQRPLREASGLGLAERLRGIGVQRLEFDSTVTLRGFEDFLDDVVARLGAADPLSAPARPSTAQGIRFGAVGVREAEQAEARRLPGGAAIGAEFRAVRRLHEDVRAGRPLDVALADGVARALDLALHAEPTTTIPLVKAEDTADYHVAHALNTSLLTMAVAEHLGLPPRESRAFGVAALLHDVGMLLVPQETLEAARALDVAEWETVRRHVADGARILLAATEPLELAAAVAYEHHMAPVGGYPEQRPRPEPHYASRLVRVCSVYDALISPRPWGDAWESVRALAHLNKEAGTEFDPDAVVAFREMMAGAQLVRGTT